MEICISISVVKNSFLKVNTNFTIINFSGRKLTGPSHSTGRENTTNKNQRSENLLSPLLLSETR